jgi:menaquinone-9 beta-reductase
MAGGNARKEIPRMQTFDALVVGGGPAGSSCARLLVQGGLRTAVIDAARFPRVKLCAGWLSAPIWDVLELTPRDYPLGLWEWQRAHVHHAGRTYTVRCRGHFIRRYEFDELLLRRSGATLVEGHRVRSLRRGEDGLWELDGAFRALRLVGAGGTHCPVARELFPPRPTEPVTTQEHEFPADAAEVAERRIGKDGEPELLLHPDLLGYSWNVPKTGWLNVGCGTLVPRAVLPAWQRAREVFVQGGHIPEAALPMLERMRGHSYHLYSPERLAACERDGAFLAGDALGLAHPLTGEGILPAVLSGVLCAQAILAGRPETYRTALEQHPLLEDYRLLHRLRGRGPGWTGPAASSRLLAPLVARGFAHLFSGKPLPGGGLLRRCLGTRVTDKPSEGHHVVAEDR